MKRVERDDAANDPGTSFAARLLPILGLGLALLALTYWLI